MAFEHQDDIRDVDVYMFDLGNVLIYFSHAQMFRQVAEVVNHTVETVESWFTKDRMLVELETGRLEVEEFLAWVRLRTKREFLDQELFAAMADIFSTNHDMVELLPAMKEAGKKLVLVSNTNRIHFNWERPHNPWLSLFDHQVLSYEVGAMKPDPKFYQAAQKVAGAKPERCLFVDDVWENVEGARSAGFKTRLFTGSAPFKDVWADLTI